MIYLNPGERITDESKFLKRHTSYIENMPEGKAKKAYQHNLNNYYDATKDNQD
ncbi:DUF6965 family protein [Pontibacter beigongshangensis]|uniref:DUF6965 family protein n=1 Tax=Pontibacter beigongshangensis TaxID=2574733 RepID=UPI00164EE5D7|nr:hypothetical protein [Pontibacter beigongshangensis]